MRRKTQQKKHYSGDQIQYILTFLASFPFFFSFFPFFPFFFRENMYTDNKSTTPDTTAPPPPPGSHDHHPHHNHGPLSNHSYAIHYGPSPTQHMSPALSEARRPGDVIRKTTFNRISSYHDRKSTTKQVTTKLKNLFVNNREREELMTACSKGDVDRGKPLIISLGSLN